MCLREYTEEEIKEMFREDGIEVGFERGLKRGREQGIEQGIAATNKNHIINLLRKGKSPEEIQDLLDIPLDEIVKIKDRELTTV